MWPYWLIFLVPAMAALNEDWRRPSAVTGLRPMQLDAAWWLALVLLSLLIGLRFECGGDWWNYVNRFNALAGLDLAEVLDRGDPGYQLLSWIIHQVGGNIYGVNLLGATIFTFGLVMFCQSLPRPWLVLAVAVPYLVIVLGMGYARQGMALGLAMLGLLALERRSTGWFVVWVLLGATFHKSAVILLPIAAVAATRNRYWAILWVGCIALAAYKVLLEEDMDRLVSGYVAVGEQSQGALIRILMNALPAAILLRWRRAFLFTAEEARLWYWFSIISLALLAVLFASPSSTAVDRIALYLLPLQLVVFAHLPDVFGLPGRRNGDLVGMVLLYYGAVMFVWLNFAANSGYWIPYRFYLFASGV